MLEGMWEQKGLQKCSKRCLLVFVGWCGKVAQGSTAQQDQTQHWELGVGAGDPGVELGNGAHENNKQDGQPCKLGGLREQRVPPDAPGVCGSVLLGATDRWSQSLQLRGAQAPAAGEDPCFPCRVTWVYGCTCLIWKTRYSLPRCGPVCLPASAHPPLLEVVNG